MLVCMSVMSQHEDLMFKHIFRFLVEEILMIKCLFLSFYAGFAPAAVRRSVCHENVRRSSENQRQSTNISTE